MANALGLSIGATAMAVTSDDSDSPPIVRSSILTLHDEAPSEVGVPTRPGLTVAGFVDRVGDPIGVVAADGSLHRAEWAVTESMRVLIAQAASTYSFSTPPLLATTVPAHWSPQTVGVLREAIAKIPAFAPGGRPMKVISDACASMEAIASKTGAPDRGVVLVCDLGGSGTSVTLTNAASGFAPIGPTVRLTDFSGQHIDQMVLTQVLAHLDQDPEGTTAVGALTRLRDRCRAAKEQLSVDTETTIGVQLPGLTSDVRLTRDDLEDQLRAPVGNLVVAIRNMLEHNGIHPAFINSIAVVGGGANIPFVIQQLSEQLRVPVLTTPHPQLAAADGVALLATRPDAPVLDATSIRPTKALAPTAMRAAASPEPTMLRPASDETGTFAVPVAASATEDSSELAWSQDDSSPDLLPVREAGYDSPFVDDSDETYGGIAQSGSRSGRRPVIDEDSDFDDYAPLPWYRRPLTWFLGAAAVAALAFTALVVSLNSNEPPAPAPAPTTSSVRVSPSTSSTPAPSSSTETPPPPPETETVTRTVEPPPPPPAATTTTTTAPTTTAPTTTAPATTPTTTDYPTPPYWDTPPPLLPRPRFPLLPWAPRL